MFFHTNNKEVELVIELIIVKSIDNIEYKASGGFTMLDIFDA